MTRLTGGGLLAVLILTAPLTAAAQVPDTIIGASGDRQWLLLRLDYNHRKLTDDRMSLFRNDAAITAGFYPLPWLLLYGGAHFGRTDFSFRYDMTDGFDLASTVANDDVSLEAGLRIGIVQWRGLGLDVFASYEITPYQPRFDIKSARLGTPFGQFDVTDFTREHADFRYNLSQLNAGISVRYRIWRFVPRLGFQYQRLSATFDPRLDEEAAETIGLFGFDQDKAKDDLSGIMHIPAISPGLTVELPFGLALDAEFSIVPTDRSDFLTVRAGLCWTY